MSFVEIQAGESCECGYRVDDTPSVAPPEIRSIDGLEERADEAWTALVKAERIRGRAMVRADKAYRVWGERQREYRAAESATGGNGPGCAVLGSGCGDVGAAGASPGSATGAALVPEVEREAEREALLAVDKMARDGAVYCWENASSTEAIDVGDRFWLIHCELLKRWHAALKSPDDPNSATGDERKGGS